MKQYIAFLRGININGKNIISMSDLKVEFENAGFEDVSTYLNSGNVVFSTDSLDSKKTIENLIIEKFSLNIPVYVIEKDELKTILENGPKWWNTQYKEMYHNLIFILTEDSPEEICNLIGNPSEELEKIKVFNNVIFWSFDRVKYQKCNWWKKTSTKGITEKLTIRTVNTLKKICK